jgi:hypothetical protein
LTMAVFRNTTVISPAVNAFSQSARNDRIIAVVSCLRNGFNEKLGINYDAPATNFSLKDDDPTIEAGHFARWSSS